MRPIKQKPSGGCALRAQGIWLLKQPRSGARVRRAGLFFISDLMSGQSVGEQHAGIAKNRQERYNGKEIADRIHIPIEDGEDGFHEKGRDHH